MIYTKKHAAPMDKKEKSSSFLGWLCSIQGWLVSHPGKLVSRLVTFLCRSPKPVHLKYRDHTLFLENQAFPLHGPESVDQAAQAWGEIAREFAEEAEILAERIKG